MSPREDRPSCPVCGKWMEEGYLLEKGDSNASSITKWVEGAPERSRWMGLKLKGRRVLTVKSFRCPKCGLLTSVAPDPPLAG